LGVLYLRGLQAKLWTFGGGFSTQGRDLTKWANPPEFSDRGLAEFIHGRFIKRSSDVLDTLIN
jgi:hypothetical protein